MRNMGVRECLKLIFGVLAEVKHAFHPAITRFAGISLSGRGHLDEQVSPQFFMGGQGNEFKTLIIHQGACECLCIKCASSADVDGAHLDGFSGPGQPRQFSAGCRKCQAICDEPFGGTWMVCDSCWWLGRLFSDGHPLGLTSTVPGVIRRNVEGPGAFAVGSSCCSAFRRQHTMHRPCSRVFFLGRPAQTAPCCLSFKVWSILVE